MLSCHSVFGKSFWMTCKGKWPETRILNLGPWILKSKPEALNLKLSILISLKPQSQHSLSPSPASLLVFRSLATRAVRSFVKSSMPNSKSKNWIWGWGRGWFRVYGKWGLCCGFRKYVDYMNQGRISLTMARANWNRHISDWSWVWTTAPYILKSCASPDALSSDSIIWICKITQ